MRIIIFGKKGCGKCTILKSRLSKLLALPEYAMFTLEATELNNEDTIVKFCDLECLNFSRIPAFYIEKDNGSFKPKHFNSSSLSTILGLQTDYEQEGTLTVDMLKQVLDEAKLQVGD